MWNIESALALILLAGWHISEALRPLGWTGGA